MEEISWEEIDGLSHEVMTPSDNGNEPTAEIYYTDDIGEIEEVFNNVGTTQKNKFI